MRDLTFCISTKNYFRSTQRNIDDGLIILQNKKTYNTKKHFNVDNFF